MNKDQIKGRVKNAKGGLKKTAGKISGNKRQEREGTVQQSAGKVQAGYGDLKEDVKEVLKGD